MARPLFYASVLTALVCAGCGKGPERDPTIGHAFVGPATLKLRKEIDPKSSTVGMAHHGEPLEITAQRRRWYKVRTKSGAEGWTDDRQLLDNAQMERLRDLAKETSGLPSQGSGTTFDSLNVHTEPNRLSASFLQVKEGEKFDVIAHRVIERTPLPKRELIPPKPKPEKLVKKKKSSVPPPPSPAPPALPQDWVALSKERARVPEEDLPPVAKDDWTLIRTRSGESGWVLTSRVYMGIPDEVAQYAEGHRITSYFSIGKVKDGDVKKDIWLWTTSVGLGEDHDFDGYRVFTWSLRHHRYETAFIQRRETGYFPTLAKQGEFSVCLEDDNGGRVRKQFTMIGNAVKLTGTKPCEKSFEADSGSEDDIAHIELQPAPKKELGFFARLKARFRSALGK
ncbi:MAG TPA: SH3 domain-containing protein [Bryobacteraceae bacterium]|nr:SH3 domain-containing protein [Bryobacteraceae bacterium]